jgi:hypothetical protein
LNRKQIQSVGFIHKPDRSRDISTRFSTFNAECYLIHSIQSLVKISFDIEENLFPKFKRLLEKSLEDLKHDKDNEHWLPNEEEEEYCKRCRISHEAEEFFSSILEIAISEYLESKQFKQFVVNNKFAEEGFKF